MVNATSSDFGGSFKEYLQLYKFTAKLAVERMELIRQSPKNSAEQRIHVEVMNHELKPKLDEQGHIIYSAILSFNKKPSDFPSLSREDIQEAQLVQDEVVNILRNAAINVQFTRDEDTY